MAGVGFELNKLLAKQGYTGLLQAYGYAALIGSGPWLVSVISLGMLGAVLTTVSDSDELQMFFVSISLVYAVTLVLSGPIQMVLTRHAAVVSLQRVREVDNPVLHWRLTIRN